MRHCILYRLGYTWVKWISVFPILFILVLLTSVSGIAQDTTGSFYHDGILRNYDLYFPQHYKPNQPVVFVLGGHFYPPYRMEALTLMHEYADTLGFLVVYAEGSRYHGEHVWNMGLREYPGSDVDTTVDDVGFLCALIDTLSAHYSIDTGHVFCCGWSMGGMMTYRMAIEEGHRFRAFASVSGSLNGGLTALGSPDGPNPILHIHGTSDSVVWYSGGPGNILSVYETLNFWLRNDGCGSPPLSDTVALPDINTSDSSTVEKITWSDCEGSAQVQFYKVFGGGHTWPGHPPGINTSGGTNNLDMSASVEILKFFKYYGPVFASESGHLLLDTLSIGCYRMDTLVVRNEGIESLTIDSVKSDCQNLWIEPESVTIAPGDSALFFITSTPADEGPYSGNLIFNHNDPSSPDTVIVSGTGTGDGPVEVFTIEGTGWQMVSPGVVHTIIPDECPIVFSPSYCYEVGYLREDTLEAGCGYWYKMSGPITFVGTRIESLWIEVKEGWNLVGSVSEPVPVDTITSDPPGIVTTDFYQYDSTGYSVTDTLHPGHAYWVKVSGNGELFLSPTGGSYPLNRIVIRHTDEMPPPPPEELGTISKETPTEYSLEQNYPNPFNPVTEIRYTLPVSGHVTLTVYNILGQKVRELVNGRQEAGLKTITFDAIDVPSGVYTYRFTAGSFTDVKRMLLLK